MIKRDQNGWYVNLDLVFVYLVLLVGVAAFAIKAIRWAVS